MLTERGVPVIAPNLPGHGGDVARLGGVGDDAARVREVIGSVDGEVVLFGHSYGGIVISETARDSTAAAKIAHLVYLCAICVPQGKTWLDVESDYSKSTGEPLPATYVPCTDDRMIPIEAQREFVASCRPVALDLTELEWPTSHSPFFSRPDLVADLLEALARA